MSIQKQHTSPFLSRLSEGIFLVTGLATLATTLMITYDVLMRYFFNQPQLFVDELTSFFLVGIIFLGTAPTFHKGGHIRIDLVTNLLRPATQRRLRTLTLAVGMAILGLVTYETALSTMVACKYGRVSAVMSYPLWVGMMLIPIGLLLMAVFMLANLIQVIRSGATGRDEKFSGGPH